jgi:hypothetical protein
VKDSKKKELSPKLKAYKNAEIRIMAGLKKALNILL